MRCLELERRVTCCFDAAAVCWFRETLPGRTHPTGMARRPSSLHWPEYFIEGAAIAVFMVSAALFAATLYHPSSPITAAISADWLRRWLMGLAMGSTAVLIVYSPWGQRSRAHMNPSMTLTFYRLGKVAGPDCLGYVTAQFTGGIIG